MKMYMKTQNQMNLLRIHRDLKKEIKKNTKNHFCTQPTYISYNK